MYIYVLHVTDKFSLIYAYMCNKYQTTARWETMGGAQEQFELLQITFGLSIEA